MPKTYDLLNTIVELSLSSTHTITELYYEAFVLAFSMYILYK